MAEPARIAVIIVSYNTVDLLRKALASVAWAVHGAQGRLAVEALVVDNASSDGSAAMVRAEFPWVKLLASERNLGFPAANNLAMQRLGIVAGSAEGGVAGGNSGDHAPTAPAPHYLFLLNPDAEVTGDALEQLVDFMEARPDVALAGPSLRYGDGSFQHGAFAFPGVAQVALDLFPFGRLPGGHRLYAGEVNGRYAQRLWQGETAFPVDFVLGAAMFVRADAVRQVGGMDEGYFMYCEEMDWALRFHQAGWEVCALPTAIVLHHEAQSSRQMRWVAWRRLWESRLRFYALHGDVFAPWTAPVVRWLVRWGMRAGIGDARRRFGAGVITGTQAGEEIAARRAVLGKA